MAIVDVRVEDRQLRGKERCSGEHEQKTSGGAHHEW
jgi:hypothetical protein